MEAACTRTDATAICLFTKSKVGDLQKPIVVVTDRVRDWLRYEYKTSPEEMALKLEGYMLGSQGKGLLKQ